MLSNLLPGDQNQQETESTITAVGMLFDAYVEMETGDENIAKSLPAKTLNYAHKYKFRNKRQCHLVYVFKRLP